MSRPDGEQSFVSSHYLHKIVFQDPSGLTVDTQADSATNAPEVRARKDLQALQSFITNRIVGLKDQCLSDNIQEGTQVYPRRTTKDVSRESTDLEELFDKLLTGFDWKNYLPQHGAVDLREGSFSFRLRKRGESRLLPVTT